MADKQPKRSNNFSASDNLLLAEIMDKSCGVDSLNYHAYMKQRFSPSITTHTKKAKWEEVETQFNLVSQTPRSAVCLRKKWDNLVQIHRALYSEYKSNQQKTGGGPKENSLSVLTEAMINVIGKQSTTVLGVNTSMDSTMMMLNTMGFFSTWQPQSGVALENPRDPRLQSRTHTTQTVCCNCGCHRNLEMLKEQKIKLQIKLLKKQLNECE